MKQGFKACVCAVVLCAELFAAGALSAYAAQEQPLPDSGMTLDTAELTLDITEGDPAPVAYLNVQAPNDYFFLIWTSSDPAVASVDGTGKVTGHAEGTAAVTARNERGEKTTCTITVRKSTASRLVLNTSELALTITEQEPAPTKQLKLEQNKGGFGGGIGKHKRHRKGAGVRQGRHQRTDHSRAGAALHGNGHIGDRTGADEQKRHAAAGSGSQSEADRAGCRRQKRNDDMAQQQSGRGNCECGWHGNGGGRR